MERQRPFPLALRRLARLLPRACAGLAAWAALAPVTAAEELLSEPVRTEVVQAQLDKSIALHASGGVGKVVVAQPELVQVNAAGPDHLYVIGREVGITNLLVYDRQGRLAQTLDIQVGYDAEALRETLAEALPGEPITVKALSSTLLLEGEVSSPSVVAMAERLAEIAAPGAVISRLQARASQVRLEVRMVEISTRGLRDVNAALSLGDGDSSIQVGGPRTGVDVPFGTAALRTRVAGIRLNAALQALEERGELRMMARPTLVALSGETAKFRAGGEFPFPVPADLDKIVIEFRPYGASMAFKPVIQENGLIRVEMEAELSDIDPAMGIQLRELTVPGLSTRRAATTAELHDGEALVIAGLFEDSRQTVARQVPFLSEIPVIRSIVAPVLRAFRKKETHREVAFIVTAKIGAQVASPLADDTQVAAAWPEPPQLADTTTPKSAAGPRGPPLKALVAEIRDTLRPPMRWARQIAHRFTAALSARA